MTVLERLRRTRDLFALKAVRLIPLRVRYWSTVMHVAEASQAPEFNRMAISMITVTQMLEHLERPKVVR